MLRPFIVLGFSLSATAAIAQPVPMGNEQLKATVSGAVVEIDTPLGTKLPVRFGTDGLVSADAGDLAPILGSKKDRGRWWIDGDKLCSKWFRWFDSEPRCLTISMEGDRVYWRKDDGETGTATLVRANPSDTPAAKTPPATVVAKAEEPAPAKPTPAPRAKLEAALAPELAPSPAQDAAKPAPEATASASPAEPVETLVQTSEQPKSAPVEPVMIARATPAASDEPNDDSMMRFGGAGLLEASSRIPTDQPVGDTSSSEEAAKTVANVAAETKPAHKAETRKLAVASISPSSPRAAAPTRAAVAPPKPAPQAKREATDASARKGPVRDASLPANASYRVTGVQRYDVLNVRSGPSEMHDQIGAIPPNARRIKITGPCNGEWCPVSYGRERGWVNSFYLVEDRNRQGSSSPVYVARP